MIKKFFLSLIAVTLLATGCTSAATGTKQQVVVSIFPLFDAASSVGGSRVKVTNLSPLDPFGPLTDKKANLLRSAGLAIILGKGTQPEIERIAAERSGPTLRVLDLIEGQPSLLDSSKVDPYVWMNPHNQERILVQVRNALIAFDSGGTTKYTKNTRNLLKSMTKMDQRFEKELSECKYKDLIVEDPFYQYFASRYGFNLVTLGVAGRTLDSAIEQFRPNTVFMAELPSLSSAKKMKSTYGVRVSTLDPIAVHTDQARRGGATYSNMMNLDVNAIKTGLGCS